MLPPRCVCVCVWMYGSPSGEQLMVMGAFEKVKARLTPWCVEYFMFNIADYNAHTQSV